jgi:Lactoylglutathione lyase and related lyases
MNPPIHHVSLLTRHSQENVAFYTQLLGLRFVKNTVNQENHRMLHYYYGDYQGAPGTVVTFFIVPLLGHRYDQNHFLATIGLKVPRNSLNYWQDRLTQAGVTVEKNENTLIFKDPDDVTIYLSEIDADPLPKDHQAQNDVPGDKQLIGIRSTEFHVPDAQATSDFFEQLLGWSTKDGRIQLNETDFVDIIQTETTDVSRMGRGSMDHIAFAIKDDETLEALHQKAIAQGWNVEKIISRGYFKSLYIREPGDNRVEFATMAPGFTIDEPLETLGESFALPPFLADQRAEIEQNIYKEQ